MACRISQEVTRAITEYLDDDPLTLIICSQVCRSFLAPCRRILFQEFYLKDPPTGSTALTGRFILFVKLLQDSPGVAASIETLRIVGNHRVSPRPVLDIQLLAVMLSLLPNLSHLRIACLSLHSGTTEPGMHLLPSVPPTRRFNVQHVCIFNTGSERDSPGDLLRLLSLFGTINSLMLHSNLHFAENARQKARFPSDLAVQYLAIKTVPCVMPPPDFYFSNFKRMRATRTLRMIDMDCIDKRDMTSLGKLIAACAPRLRDVTVGIEPSISLDPGKFAVIPAQCTTGNFALTQNTDRICRRF